jgi:hypothetical protein
MRNLERLLNQKAHSNSQQHPLPEPDFSDKEEDSSPKGYDPSVIIEQDTGM